MEENMERDDLDEFALVLRHLEMSDGEGFALHFVATADPAAAGACRAAFGTALAALGKRAVDVVMAADGAIRTLDDLVSRLPSLLLGPDYTPDRADIGLGFPDVAAAWIDLVGLPDAEPWRSAAYRLGGAINQCRNPLRARVARHLVIVAPMWAIRRIRDNAPDLWSVRDLVVVLPDQAST